MKISLEWLREFVDLPAGADGLRADLPRLGLGIESAGAVGGDIVFDLEVTTNRPDCLSHYGVARELAACSRQRLRFAAFEMKESSQPTANAVSIEIRDPDLCARYCGRVIQGVEVKPSPAWLARRLEGVGVRSINNVADATNYVLMELGHPLHAFDLARLRGPRIVVRRARTGERLRTLDGVERTLTDENLVIADAERPVALAGVMGGEESQIVSSTRSVLLESAWFDPVSIRRTAKAHGMHTEASHRFERGADVEMARAAVDRTAQMIADLAGGEILAGVIDVYPRPWAAPQLTLRASEVARILGTVIPEDEIERILRALGFQVSAQGEGKWVVRVPSWRPDVGREVDLVEELARHHGYDSLPSRVRPAPPRVERDRERARQFVLTSVLTALGYREIIASSMVDPGENARFTARAPVVLLNPLSQEASALRSTTVAGMLRALRWNLDRNQNDLRLFEVGKVYTTSARTEEGLPLESRVLTLGSTGSRRPASAHDSVKELGFFDLKGDLEAVLEAFDISDLRFEPGGCGYHDPARAGRFVAGGATLIVFGDLAHDAAAEYKLRQKVHIAEVDLERLMRFALREPSFRPISRFPAVERDFSLLVPAATSYGRLEQSIRNLGLAELRDVRPVDLFEGGSVPAGHRSLLLRVTFQSTERTLAGAEVDAAAVRLLSALEPLGIRVRT